MTPDAPPRHILAINDDREMLRLYTEILTDEGYLVSIDQMPATDLDDVHAVGPDLIVLDLIVGRQELGTAFLALLRSDPSTRFLPVLVCSADTQRLIDLDEQLQVWDCDVLAKPFDIDEFVTAVRASLARRYASPEG